ncbi:MAG: hypothetical protein P1P64_03655 [Treponemataceae bacterium]
MESLQRLGGRTDEIGSIDLSSNELRVKALTKQRPDGYCDCWWKREVTP